MRERVCKNCGGRQYKVVGQNMVKCRFCGTLYVDESSSKEEEVLVVGAYEKLRNYNFVEAVEEFNKILSLYPMSFEASFGKALAKNKIVLYNNKRGASKNPRFFGEQINSITDDENFENAVKNAPPERAKTFTEIAKKIDRIKKLYDEKTEKTTYDCVALALGNNEKVENVLSNLSENNISVYYIQSLEKEVEENTFEAIKTANVLLLFVGDDKNLTSGEIKNIYDRYLYAISQKKKLKSSLLLAIDSNVDLSALPKELNVKRNIFSYELEDFVESFVLRVKNELKKAVVETAKIEKVKIEKVEPVKKENVNVETINPNELGHYHIDNVQLSEENKIKWIYLSLKHGDFNSASELIEKELVKDPNNAELLFAKLLWQKNLKTREEFFSNISNFQDKEVIDKILTYASKEFAESFVDDWEKLIEKIDSEEYYNTFLLYLAKFDTANRDKFVNCAENKAVETMNEELIDKVLKCFDNSDIERYIAFYFTLAQKSDNNEYYKKILEIDAGHEQSNLTLLLQKFKTDEDKLSYNNKEEVESILQYLSEDVRGHFVAAVVNLILPLAFSDVERVESQLDFYLAYVSNDEKLVEILKDIASEFQNMGFFKQAEKYPSIAISKGLVDAEAYWNLIKIKLHCKNDQELIKLDVKITEMPEWETLLATATEEQTEKYAKLISRINLYSGEKEEYKNELLDKKQITEKLRNFLDRNNKILLEIEKQEGEKVLRGVEYYRLQLKPFENYLQTIQHTEDINEYQDVVAKINTRLESLDLTLDSSVNVTKLYSKEEGLESVYQTRKIETEELTKKANELKKTTFIKKYLCGFLEFFPLLFTTLLMILVIAVPKDVFMYFSQEFLILSVFFSLIVGFINLFYYYAKKKKISRGWKSVNIILFCVSLINLILLAVGFYLTPSSIEINNAKELKVLMNNAGYSKFELKQDIDMKGVTWKSVNFYGELDGNNHKITNLMFSNEKNVGFFNQNSGKVENLEIYLAEAEYSKIQDFGAIASTNSGIIRNCKVYGNVILKSQYEISAGTLIGSFEDGTLENCYSGLSLTVTTQAENVYVGGLFGQILTCQENIIIKNNITNIKLALTANDVNSIFVGGMAGYMDSSSKGKVDISKNALMVNIVAEGESENVLIGGLFGLGRNESENNYVEGLINASNLVGSGYIGGLYGEYDNTELTRQIKHSYSNLIFSTNDGIKNAGLVGELGGKINSCFSTVDASLIANYKYPQIKEDNCQKLLDKYYDYRLNFDSEIWNLSEESYPTLK